MNGGERPEPGLAGRHSITGVGRIRPSPNGRGSWSPVMTSPGPLLGFLAYRGVLGAPRGS